MRPLLLALSLAAASPLAAQDFDFYSRGPYRAAVPRPETLLGYRVGSRHTMYYQQQQVLDRLIAAAPDRVRTEAIGTTVEGKPMRLLIISAPMNLAKLDQIKADLAALADPRRTTAAEAKAIADRIPAVALVTHSVHGNEPAGFEAVMQTAYQLLASDDPKTLAILEHTVVLLNPSQNPDGHERFAAWNNSVAVASDDPAALEREEPWPIQGRYNHYRFDMNRDMLAQSQPEARALAGVVRRWHPQVVADLHSTVEQYFFPPVSQAVNAYVPPSTLKWFETFGKGNAAAFDAYGWQYYIQGEFDFFYPGYIDEWPSLQGAVGMTYETDGGPPLRLRKDDGTVTTFEMGIAHHYVASLATLETLANNHAARLLDYYQFHADAVTQARAKAVKRIVFRGDDATRARWVAHRLAEEGVDVMRTTAPLTSLRATSYLGGAAGKQTFPAGSYVVDLAQPQGRLAATLLEPKAAFDSTFASRQFAKFERNRRRGEDASREGYDFYDITAWSLPYAQGLDAWQVEDLGPVQGDAVRGDEAAPTGAVTGRAQSAYVFGTADESGTRLALKLLGAGVRVAAARLPFVADNVTYPRGTFVVRVQRNGPDVHDKIAAFARETGANVAAVRSAFPDTGGMGTGSEAVTPIYAPKIIVVGGTGIGQTAFGAAWHYFDVELGQPVTPMSAAGLGRADLTAYNVIYVPDGTPDRVAREIGDAGMKKLAEWVRGGGSLILTGDLAVLASRKELGLSTVKALGTDEEEKKPDQKPAPKDTTLSASAQLAPPLVSPGATGGTKPEPVMGAIFRAALDRTHWLTYGYERDELPVMLNGDVFLTPSKAGDNPVAFTAKTLALSGFVWPNNTERLLKGTVWAAVESPGRGHVTMLVNDPLFRAYWRSTAKLVTNAVLFGSGREAR